MAGFVQKELLVKFNLVTGNDMWMQEYLYFNSDLFGALRAMTETDGISDPKILQPMLERFGPYVASGFIHDGAFRGKLEQQQPDGSWAPFMLADMNDGRANQLIEEALKSEGCSWLERTLIYHALEMFGWKAFDDDRADLGNKPSQADLQKLIKPA
jgi:Protein of unknown function (DUF1353)